VPGRQVGCERKQTVLDFLSTALTKFTCKSYLHEQQAVPHSGISCTINTGVKIAKWSRITIRRIQSLTHFTVCIGYCARTPLTVAT